MTDDHDFECACCGEPVEQIESTVCDECASMMDDDEICREHGRLIK